MTDRLVNDPDAVAVLAARVADDVGLPRYASREGFLGRRDLRGVTRSASELGVEVVFKGGTSLSEVCRLIERTFSGEAEPDASASL
jgi:hypothetical protein